MVQLLRSLLACLLGCGIASSAAQTSEPVARQRLGIAVVAGHELHLLRIGALVFGNSRGLVRASDAGIAEQVYLGLKDEIALEARYDIARVAVDMADVDRLSKAREASPQAFWTSRLKELHPDLATLAGRCACDLLLLATVTSKLEVFLTNQHTRGLTLVEYRRVPYLLIPLHFDLIDARTLKAVGYDYWASVEPAPALAIAGDLDQVAALSDTQWQEVRDAASRLFRPRSRFVFGGSWAGSLALSLYDLGVRPSCAMHAYKGRTSQAQRDPVASAYMPPPPMPPGADESKCPAGTP